jgi:hypothetical protein
MGYYSDVCMAIRAPKGWLLAELATLRLTGDEARKQALDELMLIEDNANKDFAILYLRDNCKWYAGYTDVAALGAIWGHFVEALELGEGPDSTGPEDPRRNIDAAFVRVGDEYDDIESRYHGSDPYDLASPSRSIEIGFDLEAKDIRPRLNPAA